MRSRPAIRRILFLSAVFVSLTGIQPAVTQDTLPHYRPLSGELTSQDGAWEYWNVDGAYVALRQIELVPQSEPKPALSVELIPNAFHQKDGNAAVHYLQAAGFFEQTAAWEAKRKFERDNSELARLTEKPISEVPPQSWRSSRPENLPIEQVKEYLNYTSFQTRYLKEAVKVNRCDFERQWHDIENPIGYLLPEIQNMRELARNNSLRFLLAMAEDRTEDAVAILGQQLALGRHIAHDAFLVSGLVGIACAQMGLNDAYYLCEHRDAPNLYWAIAALPQPLVDLRPALAYEREMLFEQVKKLREVDETPRSSAYWTRFVDEFYQSTGGMDNLDDATLKPGKPRFVLSIAAGIPGAKRYLTEVEGLTIEQLAVLPNTQIYFLAVRRFYERSRDEMFKWSYASQWERDKRPNQFSQEIETSVSRYGSITNPTRLLLPAVQAAMAAQTRLSQQLAILQTIEAIRHHLATHSGQLPESLAALDLAAPMDPVTGRSFNYVRHSQGATLSGGSMTRLSYQFELRVSQ